MNRLNSEKLKGGIWPNVANSFKIKLSSETVLCEKMFSCIILTICPEMSISQAQAEWDMDISRMTFLPFLLLRVISWESMGQTLTLLLLLHHTDFSNI